jgi:excisionase family DNA binding protein
MRLEDALSVPEAAERLAVNQSRIRAMLASGGLAGTKVGGRWLVAEESVRARQRVPRQPGRQLQPANAWGVLMLGSGQAPAWLPAAPRRHLIELLNERGLAGLAPRLHDRAQVRSYLAHPGVLPHLARHEALAPSGASAAQRHRLGLVAGDEIDAYVRCEALASVVDELALEPRDTGGNVLLRVLPKGCPVVLDDVAPVAAVALDLSDQPDARSARIGRSTLERLDHERRWADVATG